MMARVVELHRNLVDRPFKMLETFFKVYSQWNSNLAVEVGENSADGN